MRTKRIEELTQDEFLRIKSPRYGSSHDGSQVALGQHANDYGVCVKLFAGSLQIDGDYAFVNAVKKAYEAKKAPSVGFGSFPPNPTPKPEPEPTLSKLMPKTQEPVAEVFDVGYYWNEYHQSKKAIYEKLYGPEANFQQQSMFERNNEHLKDMVLAGEIVILANEPTTLAEKDRLILLKTQAKKASEGIQKLTPEEAATLQRHFDVFDLISSQDLGAPSATFGAISTVAAGKLKSINAVLEELNTLYVAHTGSGKGAKSFPPEFFVQRKIIFDKLDDALTRLTMTGIKIPEYGALKHRLGLSTKSILHNWRTVSRNGEVPALGERINYISKYVNGANRIAYISIGLDLVSGGLTVHQACVVGNGPCERTASREIGRFGGAFIGGMWGAEIGGSIAVGAASSVALAFGVALSAPVIAIVGIGGAAAGGYYGGDKLSEIGVMAGDKMADMIDSTRADFSEIIYKLEKKFE